MKLYELGNDLQEAVENMSAMVQAGDMTPEEMTDNLSVLEGDFNEKVDSCLYALKNLQARSDSLKAAVSDLQGKKRTADAQVDRLKDYIRACMVGADVTKAGTGLFTAGISNGQSSVIVDNPDSLPDEFKFTSITITPDKKALAEALKAGAVEGARLEEGKPTLRIR